MFAGQKAVHQPVVAMQCSAMSRQASTKVCLPEDSLPVAIVVGYDDARANSKE
jgi:hypothetical protein